MTVIMAYPVTLGAMCDGYCRLAETNLVGHHVGRVFILWMTRWVSFIVGLFSVVRLSIIGRLINW